LAVLGRAAKRERATQDVPSRR